MNFGGKKVAYDLTDRGLEQVRRDQLLYRFHHAATSAAIMAGIAISTAE